MRSIHFAILNSFLISCFRLCFFKVPFPNKNFYFEKPHFEMDFFLIFQFPSRNFCLKISHSQIEIFVLEWYVSKWYFLKRGLQVIPVFEMAYLKMAIFETGFTVVSWQCCWPGDEAAAVSPQLHCLPSVTHFISCHGLVA